MRSISLGVVSFVLFLSLVRLSSSSTVYLFLLWVLGGHCLSPLPHFFGWNSIERILALGSYCSDFRVIRPGLVRIPPLYQSFDLPYTCPIMRTSSRPSCSSGPRIGGRPAEEFKLRRTGGGSSSLIVVVDRAPPTDHPSPSGKGKRKISEIRYPSCFEYLKADVKYANAKVLVESSPFMKKPSLLAIDPLLAFKSGALIFSLPTSSRFLRWSASLKRPSRMVFAFLCTPLSRTSYSTSTFSHPNFLPISRVF